MFIQGHSGSWKLTEVLWSQQPAAHWNVAPPSVATSPDDRQWERRRGQGQNAVIEKREMRDCFTHSYTGQEMSQQLFEPLSPLESTKWIRRNDLTIGLCVTQATILCVSQMKKFCFYLAGIHESQWPQRFLPTFAPSLTVRRCPPLLVNFQTELV